MTADSYITRKWINRWTVAGKYLALLLTAYSCKVLWAQSNTASGKLALSAKVQSSIGLVFTNDANVGTTGFCPLTNAGTNNVGLDFGTASFTTGDSLSCVAFFTFGTAYFVTSAFDVTVFQANGASASYNLAAKVKTAPPVNVTWFINFAALSTAFTTFQTNNTYGQPVLEFLTAQVDQSVPAGSLNEEIDFLATAN